VSGSREGTSPPFRRRPATWSSPGSTSFSRVRALIPRPEPGIAAALGAALLFGASTPLAKRLLGETSPWLLAGLLYVGSGLGLFILRRVRRAPRVRLSGPEAGWLAGAVAAGGMLGPALLMWGLARMPASDAALLLNAEAVFTALTAWFVFRENFDCRIAFGMALIVAGASVLSWPGEARLGAALPAAAVLGACLAWALDNNLTRKVSLADADYIAMVKGLVAGTTNAAFALAAGSKLPAPGTVLGAGIIGFLGYGVSLALFVFALRQLGTARTGAYFSTAPFAGAIIAMALLREPLTTTLAIAAVLMAAGVWLHVSERHEHRHTHDLLEHTHEHGHDVHHQHAHGEPVAPGTRHTHRHRHEALTHSHPHYPDAHHRHGHHSCPASVLERDGSPSG
jgi:drug/metabolite transporter (DMT)-like permease